MNLKVKRLTETARLPEKAYPTEAGYDVYADEDVVIHNGQTVAISTGLAVEIPEGYYGRLTGRSGLTLKSPLRVQEGTIDSSYRGEIKIMVDIKAFSCVHMASLFTQLTPSNSYIVEKGMKIAQLIIQPLPLFELEEANVLSESVRGENGFGSTGV